MEMSGTICWKCERACTNGCSWSERNEPVTGWVAVKNEASGSYSVLSCPLFDDSKWAKDNIDYDGARDLVAGIIKWAVLDHEKGSAEEAISCERFVTSRYFRAISNIEPQYLLRLMRERRKEYLLRLMQERRKECPSEALEGHPELSESEV